MAFFPVVIISHPRNFFNFILGFTGERGSGCPIIPSGVTVSLKVILR